MKTNPDPVRRSARYVAKACSAIRMLYCCVPFTTPKSSMKANTDDGLQKTTLSVAKAGPGTQS